ncbi:hypothetical protein GPALN_014367 [Globodera pallida]|nr:hypothetical protein GPALN_014367 [Globodera pallida]
MAFFPAICSWYNMCRFDLNPIDGMQHILLDNLYTDYFLDNSATEQRLIMLKIAICTHVYMMRWTIEQNMDKLSKMRTFRPVPDGHDDDAGTSNKAGENALRTKVTVKKNETRYEMPQSNFDSTHYQSLVTMCFLLKFKFQLFHALSATTNFGIFPNENVSCKSAKSIRQSVEMNLESIREWMLSDLMHFFKRRPKLVKFFE